MAGSTTAYLRLGCVRIRTRMGASSNRLVRNASVNALEYVGVLSVYDICKYFTYVIAYGRKGWSLG